MLLLVSTPLHILLVNAASGETSTLRTGDGYYYGITYKPGSLVLSHSGGYLGYFDGDSPRYTCDHLIQPHQIEWIDDQILVANTGRNCLSVFDGKGQLIRDVYLNDVHWDDKDKGREGNHFNSVHRSGERVYVVAHNYRRPSEVWELTWPELEVTTSRSSEAGWAHNVWICEGQLVICNSRAGTLYEVLSGETLWTANEEGVMTRGLAVSDDYVFVGRSQHHERKERYWKDGGIWILDRQTLTTLDKIILPGSGDVHEIRLVGSADECHNEYVISLEDVLSIESKSPFITWAYRLRKSNPALRRDLFPLSQAVRAVQMTTLWSRWFQRLAREVRG